MRWYPQVSRLSSRFYIVSAVVIAVGLAGYLSTGRFEFWGCDRYQPAQTSGVSVASEAPVAGNAPEEYLNPGPNFKILDPYSAPGKYYKAQLHTHTTRSDGKMKVEDVVKAYEAKGFKFLAITDHDKVFNPGTSVSKSATSSEGRGDVGNPDIVIIPGEEHTIPYIFWPLGHHMSRLFVTDGIRARNAQDIVDSTQRKGGLAIPCHPSWTGNLGTGEWTEEDLTGLFDYRLMEIYNFHSDTAKDIERWHAVLRSRGPRSPVWGIAVDDSHEEAQIGMGWVMVKVRGTSLRDVRNALRDGHFYATTGPVADFGVKDRRIVARLVGTHAANIRFIDSTNKPVAIFRTVNEASYEPGGKEGFVRVEITDVNGDTAWSQPFWLVKGGK